MKTLLVCGAMLCGALCSCFGTRTPPSEILPPEPTPIVQSSRDGINPYVAERIIRFAEESRRFRHVELPEREAQESAAPTHSPEEREILALVIYQEAGGDACSDETRLMVGCVFLNRVENDGFPDSFYDVATQKGQYGTLHWTGIRWPERASAPGERAAVERAYAIAERVLNGERVLSADAVWQAEFPQGTEVLAISDNMYFCR